MLYNFIIFSSSNGHTIPSLNRISVTEKVHQVTFPEDYKVNKDEDKIEMERFLDGGEGKEWRTTYKKKPI